MIPLLISSFAFTASVASATVWFLRRLTRKPRINLSVDIAKATESLTALSVSSRNATEAFKAFAENPALKYWAKTQP